MNKSFAQRIAAMNAMYKLPANERPALPPDVADRLAQFKTTLMDEVDETALRQSITAAVNEAYDKKVERIGRAENGVPIMRHVEKDVMLRMLDQHWRDHLAAMDYLRQGIHLRGYAQKDYRFEYKREAFELFAAMLERVKFETVSLLSKVEVRTPQ